MTLFSWFNRVTEESVERRHARSTLQRLCYNIFFNRLRDLIRNSEFFINDCNKVKAPVIFGAPTIVLVQNDKAPTGLLDAIYKFLSI